MKKTFILTQFGKPHPWTQQFIDEVQFLEQFGWEWKIFTPNEFKSKGNVEIVYMTMEGFNQLCASQLGIFPHVQLKDGLPDKPMSDFYIASGQIFRAWLKDSDYWGITNWDVVYGRLDHFLPDNKIVEYDVLTDETASVNGVFSLFRNFDTANRLFEELKNWKELMCSEQLFGTDEYGLTKVLDRAVEEKRIKAWYPYPYPLHSHDRLSPHQSGVKLERRSDGSLWELLEDIGGPLWKYAHKYIGREIPYFHFIRTKRFPELLTNPNL